MGKLLDIGDAPDTCKPPMKSDDGLFLYPWRDLMLREVTCPNYILSKCKHWPGSLTGIIALMINLFSHTLEVEYTVSDKILRYLPA